MIRKRLALTAALCIAGVMQTTWACIGPFADQSAGVLLNSNETLDLAKFAELGVEGTHYLMECEKIPSNAEKARIEQAPEKSDAVMIKSVTITGTVLSIQVSYGGGGKTHDFDLYAMASPLKIYPPIFNLRLHHDNNGDVSKSLIEETLVFDLSAVLENLSLARLNVGAIGENSADHSYLYYKDNHCSVKYASHNGYNDMVYVDFASVVSNGVAQVFPRITIMLNPDVQPFAPVHKGNLVRDELEWLEENGILSGLRPADMKAIPNAILTRALQYWTYQDSAIQYNCYFEYSPDKNGQWGEKQCLRAPCGEDVAFELPPEPLGEVTGIEAREFSQQRDATLKAAIHENSLIIAPPAGLRAGILSITDARGKNVLRRRIAAGENTVIIDGNVLAGQGFYIIRFVSGRKVFTSRIMNLQ